MASRIPDPIDSDRRFHTTPGGYQPTITPSGGVVVSEIHGPSVIKLVVPADEDYVAMVRLVVGRAASLVGFSLDGIDDLCLAVAEAVILLIGADPSSLDVRLEVNPDSLDGEVGMTSPTKTWPTPDLEQDIRWQILEAVFQKVWTLPDGRSGIAWHQLAR